MAAKINWHRHGTKLRHCHCRNEIASRLRYVFDVTGGGAERRLEAASVPGDLHRRPAARPTDADLEEHQLLRVVGVGGQVLAPLLSARPRGRRQAVPQTDTLQRFVARTPLDLRLFDDVSPRVTAGKRYARPSPPLPVTDGFDFQHGVSVETVAIECTVFELRASDTVRQTDGWTDR